MSFFENARQSKFIKHTEKQENVSRFTGFYLDRLSIVETPTLEQRSIALVARSPSSPVARSLFAALRDCAALDVRFQIIFCRLEPSELTADWSSLALAGANSLPTAELRWARHPGLVDAHEQMVLGLGQSWQGDCMRRDPETRDAFETFETFNTEAARRGQAAFKAIWRMCDAVPQFQQAHRASCPQLLPADVLSQATAGVLGGAAAAPVTRRH